MSTFPSRSRARSSTLVLERIPSAFKAAGVAFVSMNISLVMHSAIAAGSGAIVQPIPLSPDQHH